MNTTIEILGYGGIVPAAVSIAVAFGCRRLLPPAISERYAAAAALATAFFVGDALLPWTELLPKRHWQWLPYAGVVAMLAGPLTLASGVHAAERWLMHLVLALATACLLVPAWSTLQPPRPVFIGILAAYLFLLMSGLDALPGRLLGRLFLAHLIIVTMVVAVLLAVAVSVKFGQLAGIATAALAGCWASSFFGAQAVSPRGMIPVFVVLVGGLAFVGCIEPQQPMFGMLLAPAAPLTLWAFTRGPLARLGGKQAAAAQMAIVLTPLAVAACWVLIG